MAMIFSRIVIKTSEFNEEGGVQRKPIASPTPNIIQQSKFIRGDIANIFYTFIGRRSTRAGKKEERSHP